MKIYTRTGDAGETSLFDGRRVKKHDPRPDAYGTVDELNTVVGLAAAHCRDRNLAGLLETIQGRLLVLGAELANPDGAGGDDRPRITAEMVQELERVIDAADEELEPLTGFILPGGSPSAAALHHARTVCRRAERKLTHLVELGHKVPGALPLAYVNRLSDTLFTLARLANLREGTEERPWKRR
jgi:cob(I)alamin adenosyltransferase